MKRIILLLPEASGDVAAAQFFYEEQSPDLGSYFRQWLDSELAALAGSAGVHRVVQGYHRRVCKRFPYAIFYRVSGGIVSVYAIFDCRRDPREIRQRLRGA